MKINVIKRTDRYFSFVFRFQNDQKNNKMNSYWEHDHSCEGTKTQKNDALLLWHYYIFMSWAPLFLIFLLCHFLPIAYMNRTLRCIVQAPWNSYFIMRNEPRTFHFIVFFASFVVVMRFHLSGKKWKKT